MTPRTKKYRTLFILFAVVSVLLKVGPLAAYGIMAVCGAGLFYQKFALVASVFIVLLMSLVAWANHITMRSRVWVVLIGLYFCLNHIVTPLLVIGITQIVDEVIVSPLRGHYHNKYTINREIDYRG